MKPDRWKQVEELYHAALNYAPDERAAFLAEARGRLGLAPRGRRVVAL
jgi:hypothetical protein